MDKKRGSLNVLSFTNTNLQQSPQHSECVHCDGALYPGRKWQKCPDCGRFRHVHKKDEAVNSVLASATSAVDLSKRAEAAEAKTIRGRLHLNKLARELDIALLYCVRCTKKRGSGDGKKRVSSGSLCKNCLSDLLCAQLRQTEKTQQKQKANREGENER